MKTVKIFATIALAAAVMLSACDPVMPEPVLPEPTPEPAPDIDQSTAYL